LGSDFFYNIAQEIENNLGSLLGFRVYSAISDRNGKILFAREDYNDGDMLSYISNFIKNNFDMLQVGDHSFPISGKNFGFFKISNKCIIVLHTKKGPIGALLSFKSKMFAYSEKIDNQIGEIFSDVKVSTEKTSITADSKGSTQFITQKTFAKIPILNKKLTGKEKFPLDQVLILNLCDGEHTIDEIIKKTRLPRLTVEKIIKDAQKKKLISLKRKKV